MKLCIYIVVLVTLVQCSRSQNKAVNVEKLQDTVPVKLIQTDHITFSKLLGPAGLCDSIKAYWEKYLSTSPQILSDHNYDDTSNFYWSSSFRINKEGRIEETKRRFGHTFNDSIVKSALGNLLTNTQWSPAIVSGRLSFRNCNIYMTIVAGRLVEVEFDDNGQTIFVCFY